MIVNWMFVCVFEMHKFASTYCFCPWVLQLIWQVLNVLVVSLCKPVIHKFKNFGWGEFEYYKSMDRPQKGVNQILKF